MSLESDWLARKTLVYNAIDALTELGIPFDIAKGIAGWNPTLAYDSFAAMQTGTGTPESGLRAGLRLLVSRSESRANPDNLEGAVLDAGKLYAIFVPNIPDLFINNMVFALNGVTVHTEATTPWDYAGTTVGGDAARVTFTPGSYTVDVGVTDGYGYFILSAAFDVE